jgi:mRNA-degrading endonuclease toxin of MazEF toxin-antitoxin module
VPKPEQGRIVAVEAADPQGRNVKRRPAVIVSRNSEILSGAKISCVAITTAFPDQPSEECIPLPFSPGGKARTGLKKRSAALCSWLFQITEKEITKYLGVTPPDELQKILAYLDKHSPPDDHDDRD